MNELIKELREWASVELSGTEQKEMDEILSRHETAKAVPSGSESGLRDGFIEWANSEIIRYNKILSACDDREAFRERDAIERARQKFLSLLTAPTPSTTEPLACLAYRKGQVIVLVEGFPSYWNDDKSADTFYAVRLAHKRCHDNWREYRGLTYASAEDKARAYLTALPDTTKEGGKV